MDVLHILGGAPLWVWPLFAVLFAIGYRASRDRSSPVALYYVLPLFGLMSLNGVLDAAYPTLALVFFCQAYAFSAHFFFDYQTRLITAKRDGRVHLRGDWWMMVAIMLIFWMGFAQGYVAARMPSVAVSSTYVVLTAALSGALSGQFAGRSLRVIFWRPTPSDPQAQPDRSPGSRR
ncbi:MAG: hypothetical protein AAF367_04380 [Pseudomonadota bacterium]